MKIPAALMVFVCLGNVMPAEEGPPAPRPRPRLDPATATAVAQQAIKVAATAAQAAKTATETEESLPILMRKFVVREHGTGAREAPKPEPFEGRFTPWKGGRLKSGKLGGARYEMGFWPSLEFTNLASTAMREGGGAAQGGFVADKVVRAGESAASAQGRISRLAIGQLAC